MSGELPPIIISAETTSISDNEKRLDPHRSYTPSLSETLDMPRLESKQNSEADRDRLAQAQHITFRWPSFGSDLHALAPLPETYEEAVESARRSFRRFANVNSLHPPEPDSITLMIPVKNRSGLRSVAAIEPSSWRILVQPGDEVEVWSDHVGTLFPRGQLCLSFGIRRGGETCHVWSKAQSKFDIIDRPHSFKHAVELVKARIANESDGNQIVEELKLKDLTDASFTFCFFQPAQAYIPYMPMWNQAKQDSGKKSHKIFSKLFRRNIEDFHTKFQKEVERDDFWLTFPQEAYEDDRIWRRFVPYPGSYLGIIIADRP